MSLGWDFSAEQESALKQLLYELVAIESPSGEAERIRQVMARAVEDLEGVPNVEMTWHENGGLPILELWRGRGGALLLAHADTVWPLGTLEVMPWQEDGQGKIFGPGILDMKAGLALGIYAIRSLDPATPFHLLITPDEEVGSEKSRAIIELQAQGAPVALVLESGMPNGALKIARAGVGDFNADITGVQSHAGLEPEKGASAITEAAQQILWLKTLENRVMGTSVNVGTVEGGTRSNVVPGHAQMAIDVRVQTRSEMERIESTLAHPPIFDTHTTVHYHGGFNRPPMEAMASSAAWFERAQWIWRQETGQELEGVRVGGASDGNFTAAFVATLDGLGAVGQGPHARHEHIEWSYMPKRVRLIAQLVEAASTMRSGSR